MNVIFLSVRTGSSRLPEKALYEIRDKTMIEYLIDRLKKSKYAEKVILCTTELKEDDVAVKEGKIITNGSHEELLSNSEIYKNFYEKQLKKG